MKKSVALVLLLFAAIFAVFAGGSSETPAPVSRITVNPTGFPIVNEPLTLAVFGIRDANQANWDNIYVLNEYEKMTGIHMDYQEVPDQGREEKKSLLFAANDLPDVFFRPLFTRNEITRYGVESSQLMPLNSLIEQYCPNITAIFTENPELKRALTAADGNIYALSQIDVSNSGKIGFKLWINKDWLARLGLDEPKTTEELTQVLRAFKTQDPNGNGKADEIPLALREVGAVYSTLGGSFGLHYNMGNTINIENGQIHFWLADQNFKEFLQYLNALYKEGLLWSDFYKRDLPSWRANLANALFGVFCMPYSDVFLSVEDQFKGLDPLVGPRGDQFWPDVKTGVETEAMSFALSSTCANPEAAMRWVDYFYSPEGSLFFRYGVEGKTYYFDENGNPKMNDSILTDKRGFMTALGEISLVPGGNNASLITSQTEGLVASDLTKEVAGQLVKFSDEAVFAPSFTPEETEQILLITQDLNKYRDEAVSRFIIGEYSFDMWGEYCKTLDKIGLGRLEKIYQTAYDRAR